MREVPVAGEEAADSLRGSTGAAGRLVMRAWGASEAGLVRAHNEDRFLVDAALGLAAVADGMGGHAGGAFASAATLAALARHVARPTDTPLQESQAADVDATDVDARWHRAARLRSAVERANAELHLENRMRGHPQGRGMGSTLTGLQFQAGLDACISFHVGDTRLYRCRDGALALLTRDHTARQAALESGATGTLPPANVLLQAIGPAPHVVPDLAFHDAREGDLLLLCSDGLHGCVPHGDIEALLCAPGTLHAACAGLLELARRHASRDNVTVVLARFDRAEENRHPPRPIRRRLRKFP